MKYLFSDCEQEIANIWRTYAGFTIRPVPSTIHYYQRLIEDLNSNSPSFLYGATPEIRSIFQTLNKPLVVRDQSLTIIRAMGLLTTSGAPIAANEVIQIDHWLERDLQSYDFLIVDHAINMLLWEQFDDFFQIALEQLNDDGIFVCHLLIKPDEVFTKQSFDQVVNDYHCGLIDNIYDLASRLNFICYDDGTYQMGWQHTIHQLGAYQLSALMPDLDFINQFKYCNAMFTCPPQACFEHLASQYFNIVEVFYPHEYDYCQFEPVYVLQKRKL